VRRWWRWLLALAVIAVAALALVHRCADGGAMGAAYRACDCRGIEWVQDDRTAADGPRRTLCLGAITSTACYRSRGGERVACD
jgi:hypothetical protein